MATTTVYASKDASALKSNDGWSGYDNHHPVGSNGSNTYASFIYMPLSFTGWTGITSAKLWVRGHRAGSGNHVLGAASGDTRTLNVRRMTSDWGEGTDRGETLWSSSETWGWNNRRGAFTDTGAASRVFTGYSEGTWYDIDVTDIMEDWFLGEPNYGFILAFASDTEENGDTNALEFYSRHAGSGYKPYLEIVYTTNAVPNAPINLSPGSNALVNTLNPTLTGLADDPDAGDWITAFQVKVYADDNTTVVWTSPEITQTGTSNTFSKVYSGPALVGNTFYRWTARTRDRGGEWGPFQPTRYRFKTNTPPNQPTLTISGTATDLMDLTPVLSVTHSDNDVGDSKMYGYRIIVQQSDGTAVWDSGDIDTSGAPITTLNHTYAGPALAWRTGYRFQARTKDSNGVWGSYSSWLYFTTHSSQPPINLDPSAEVVTSLTPTFTGERASSSDAITFYTIQVYANDGVTLIWDSGNLATNITASSSFSKVYAGSALSYNTSYKWRARINATNGGTSSYSSFQTFTTPADATVPSLATPTTNSNGRVTTLTPTFPGSRASTFTNYQIQLYAGTATSTNLGTVIWDSGNISQAAATSFTRVYSGTPLAWNTTYKWRARVGSPTLGTYTGLSTFTTDSAGIPTLTAPVDGLWGTSLTPTFTGTSAGGESIIAYRIRVYVDGGNRMFWDSGDIAQTAATTFSKVYNGPTMVGGEDYLWEARYTKSTGPYGPYSEKFTYHPNAAPKIPTGLDPDPGYVHTGNLYPTFKATFNDLDETSQGDVPTKLVIEIRVNATDALVAIKTITTGLNNASNQYTWGVGDAGLAYNTVYKWRAWFVDSKDAVGAASSYQTFSIAQPPTVAITSPSNGSNVATTRPLVTWSYSDPGSLVQTKYHIQIYRVSNETLVYDSGQRVNNIGSFLVPTGYLQKNGVEYRIELASWNSANLKSNVTTSTFELQLAAPPAIDGLSATVEEDRSLVRLEWDRSALGSAFVSYIIYRRPAGETNWTMIGLRKPEINNFYNDWYAGQGVLYEYRVTVVKFISGEPDLESPDSDIVSTKLASDVWFVVGQDRAENHIFELPVNDESHTRPVQQEEFEPIGSNRKAIVRGFVLGHEGSMTATWRDDETVAARQYVEYVLFYPGPHILKDPFGDVYDVTFGSPDYKFGGGGHLAVTLTWIETGLTNNPGLTPDEYLASIGAE